MKKKRFFALCLAVLMALSSAWNWGIDVQAMDEEPNGWSVELTLSTGTDLILPGGEVAIVAHVWRQNEEGENEWVSDAENIEYRWHLDENEEVATITQDTENEFLARVSVTASEENINKEIKPYVEVYLLDEGNEIRVASQNVTLQIKDSYAVIEPPYVENVGLGGTLNINPEYMCYSYGENPQASTDVRFEMEYDDTKWEEVPQDSENASNVPVLKRTSPEGTEVTIIALSNGQEIDKCSYWFDGLDCCVWVEKEEDHLTVYDNEESRSYDLNTDNLSNIGSGVEYEVEAQVGVWQEEGTVFESFGTDLCEIEKNEQGIPERLTIHPSEIKKILDEKEYGDWCTIRLLVKIGENIIGEENVEVEILRTGCEYELPNGEEYVLPGWGYCVNKELFGRIYGEGYPQEGKDFTTEVTNVSVEVLEGDKYDYEVEPQGDSWYIHTDAFGQIEVTLTYIRADDPEATDTYKFKIYVVGDVRRMDLYSDTGRHELKTEERMTLTAQPVVEYYDESRGHYREVPELEYEWSCENSGISLTAENNSNTCIVQVKADGQVDYETEIRCKAYTIGENGEPEEFYEATYRINKADEYYYINIGSNEYKNLEVGETMTITPTLCHTSEEISGNIGIRADWDPNAITISYQTDEGKQEQLEWSEENVNLDAGKNYTIKRTGDWATNISLWGELNGEEVTWRSIAFPDNVYEVYFEDIKKDKPARVFTTEDNYTITLNTQSILGDGQDGFRKGITVETELGRWEGEDESRQFCELPEAYASAITTDTDWNGNTTFAINGKTLGDRGEDENGPSFMNDWGSFAIRVLVKSNGKIVQERELWVEVRDPEISMENDEQWTGVIGLSWSYNKEEIQCHIMDEGHRYGENITAKITNITASDPDSGESSDVLEVRDENGFWNIYGVKNGDAILTFHLTYSEGGEQKTTEVNRWRSISDEMYALYIDTSSEHIVPGQETKLQTRLEKITNKDGEQTRETVPENAYSLKFDNYDESILSVDAKGNVSTTGSFGETDVRVSAKIGENQVAQNIITLRVVNEYDQIVSETVYAQPGDVISLEDFPVEFRRYDRDNLNGTKIEDCTFTLPDQDLDSCLSMDSNKITIAKDINVDTWPYETGFLVEGRVNEEGYEPHTHWIKVMVCKHSWKNNRVIKSASCKATGIMQQICEHCGQKQEVEIGKTGHSYKYVSNKNATVLSDGTKKGTCTCGATVTVKDAGSRLKATIKVPATKFPMKAKQTYKNFTVTMGKGDSIASVTSNKTKCVKVTGINKTRGTFNLVAQKSTGKATVTIKLKSGKTAKLSITVQKKDVKTSKISGLKNVSVKKGKKITLKPVITPITSKQKIKD